MVTTYLFRIDAAKDNDAFFALLQPTAFQVYAGVDINIGLAGWVPDLIKITIDESTQTFLLTLIELEATKREALISCRKYLPENSTAIVERFSGYLKRIIDKCRSTADPRKDAFVRLKELLDANQLCVTTAGALRSSADLVEELPLIDQPQQAKQLRSPNEVIQAEIPTFRGTLRFSALEAKIFGRTIMILDAVIRGKDHSVAGFKAWRQGDRVQPLKYLLRNNISSYSCLRSFLTEKGIGQTLNCDAILSELVAIWSDAGRGQFDQERARDLIISYYPLAAEIGKDESMRAIFDAARTHLASQMET